MNTQEIYIIVAALMLAAAVLGLLIAFLKLRSRFARLFSSAAPESAAEALAQLYERINRAEAEAARVEERMQALEERSRTSVQKVGFKRFNPFEHTGGDQSFALALLDQEDNGVVISSLYGREGTRVYAKYVDKGEPKHPASEEEHSVIAAARESR